MMLKIPEQSMLQTFRRYFLGYADVSPLLSGTWFTEVDETSDKNAVIFYRRTEPVNAMQDKDLAVQILADKLVSDLERYVAKQLLQKSSKLNVLVTETSKVVKIIPVEPCHVETVTIDMLTSTEEFTFPKTKVAVFTPGNHIHIDLHVGESPAGKPGLWLRESKGFVQGGFAFTLRESTCDVTDFERLVPCYG